MSVSDHEQVVRDFHAVFNTEAGERVLAWLARSCFAVSGTWTNDPTRTAANEGRREVWLMIQQMLDLTESEVREKIRALRRQSEEDTI